VEHVLGERTIAHDAEAAPEDRVSEPLVELADLGARHGARAAVEVTPSVTR